MNSPNILVILSDQLRRRALGCYGDRDAHTPHIDALAQNGVRFENSCSTYPICVPFRFSLMTGEYAHSRQVPGINWRISPAERTLADEFNDANYHTAYVGKWHLYGGLGPALMKQPIPRQYRGRWQKWLGFEFRNSFFDTVYFEDDDPTPRPLNTYQTDGLFDVAMKHLASRQNEQTPFCCVLSVEAPHPPFEAPPELEAKWLERELTLPPNFMVPDEDGYAVGQKQPEERDQVLRDRKIYYAMTENLDQNVGRMMSFLDESRLAQNTIVVFISDHGEMNGSHALTNKQYPYEESCGVPLIIWGPNCGIPQNQTRIEPTCTEDLFPTIIGLADISARDDLPGTDLTPLIHNENADLKRPGVLLEFVQELRPSLAFYQNPYRGFRSQRYKYTVLGGENGLQPWQFFDLKIDPNELDNLINDENSAERIREHHGWLRERMVETDDYVWLEAAFGYDALNAWIACDLRG